MSIGLLKFFEIVFVERRKVARNKGVRGCFSFRDGVANRAFSRKCILFSDFLLIRMHLKMPMHPEFEKQPKQDALEI